RGGHRGGGERRVARLPGAAQPPGGPGRAPARPAAPAAATWGSPTRQFTLLSLLTIGGSTLLFGFALSHFVEQGILDREWVSTAAFVRAAARFHLPTTDFATEASGGTRASGDRLAH